MKKKITIQQNCDGWYIKVDGKCFHWEHGDDDLGAVAIQALLEYLGHLVEIEDDY